MPSGTRPFVVLVRIREDPVDHAAAHGRAPAVVQIKRYVGAERSREFLQRQVIEYVGSNGPEKARREVFIRIEQRLNRAMQVGFLLSLRKKRYRILQNF